jgi:hypothetical protein
MGELKLSAWLVPAQEVVFEPPAGWRPLELLGCRLVGVVFARYLPGGDLAYRELAAGVAVRRGVRLALTIPWIWVDDRRALAGGRELWAIPKRAGRFRRVGVLLEADDDAGQTIATRETRLQVPLPGRWPFAFTIAQPIEAGVRLTPARLSGRLALSPSRWHAAGPLAMLNGRPPLLSLRLDRAEIVFGSAPAATAPGPTSVVEQSTT